MLVFDSLSLQPLEVVNAVKNGIVLDEDEEMVFDMCIRNRSTQEIAFRICKSPRTVTRMTSRLRQKILNYYDYQNNG